MPLRFQGHRTYKKVTVNGGVTLHQRYIYRGYMQIACINLTRTHHPALWFITWDPLQSVATRPLAIRKDGSWFTYGWDLTKNICEVFGPAGYIRTTYTYSPYGEFLSSGEEEQPIQWSSEYFDAELALVYYNYRHYNPIDGKWIVRDKTEETVKENIYTYCANKPNLFSDFLGNETIDPCIYECITINISTKERIKISTKSLGKAALCGVAIFTFLCYNFCGILIAYE